MKKQILFVVFFLLIVKTTFLYSSVNEEIEKGKIIKNVICRESPNHTYTLYLPTDYSIRKKWPILYAFDPGARGNLPVEQFKQAAETYGYIIAASNDARNGPWEPILSSITAIWNDTLSRFTIDLNRIYVTGFSGGSRVASYFPKVIRRPVAAIIGCGAGLNTVLTPEDIAPMYYFGVVGDRDFNYLEMMGLKKNMSEKKIAHRFLIFEGGHNWPPVSDCTQVIEWLEIIAMNSKIKSINEGLINTIFLKEMKKADNLEADGSFLRAITAYEDIKNAFEILLDTPDLRTKIKDLRNSDEYVLFLKKEGKRRQAEFDYIQKYRMLLNNIEKDPSQYLDLHNLFKELELDNIHSHLDQKNKDESALAFRQLFGLEFDARNRGWSYLDKKDSMRAILFFEIAIKAKVDVNSRLQYLYYYLACSYALGRNKKMAIQKLELAVENGLKDSSLLEEEKFFQSIKTSREFQKILSRIKK